MKMKRRNFGLMAGASAAALKLGSVRAQAQAAPDASLLKTTLTPFGSERAGNADGSIPAWTGGYTTIPAGWQPGDAMPDPFADEQPVVVIDASNMAQYSDKLTEGVMAMMTKYGFSIKVYPTHRTHSAPQEIYDNIAANVGRAQLDPAGGRFGFTAGWGGIPFPIPDFTDPYTAGPQIVWNHASRWLGYARTFATRGYAVSNGLISLSNISTAQYNYPYYKKGGSIASYNGIYEQSHQEFVAPANLIGEEIITWSVSDPAAAADIAWELLAGQGRVRKAPELNYDTPSSFTNGIGNYDEYDGFYNSLQKYDWKYIGTKELYVPYNNNAMYLLPPEPVHKEHFLDPNVIRWELHRVRVVEATLHPGERNVLVRRLLHLDEDTSIICCVDAWDANGNLYKVNTVYNYLRPDLPGTIYGNNVINNLQTDDYASVSGHWDQKANPGFVFLDGFPASNFDPQNMAAQAQY
jgi:hypothetical protein